MFVLKTIKNWFLDILFPIQDLPQNIELNQTLFCPVCRARQARNVKICHKNSQYKLGAALNYSNEWARGMIWRLKYRGKTGNAVLLGNLLTDYFSGLNLQLKNCLVIPVPLSAKRQRKRGYNQAALIAKVLAQNFNLPLENSALVRQKETPPQMEIKDWDQRKRNVINCFGIANPRLIRDKNIILVNVVFTSGATLNEAAHTLKDFGARQIIGLVVAKAG